MPLDGTAQQAAVPILVTIAIGQIATTYLDARKQRCMIQHEPRNAEHHNKKAKYKPENLMMPTPFFLFHTESIVLGYKGNDLNCKFGIANYDLWCIIIN